MSEARNSPGKECSPFLKILTETYTASETIFRFGCLRCSAGCLKKDIDSLELHSVLQDDFSEQRRALYSRHVDSISSYQSAALINEPIPANEKAFRGAPDWCGM